MQFSAARTTGVVEESPGWDLDRLSERIPLTVGVLVKEQDEDDLGSDMVRQSSGVLLSILVLFLRMSLRLEILESSLGYERFSWVKPLQLVLLSPDVYLGTLSVLLEKELILTGLFEDLGWRENW